MTYIVSKMNTLPANITLCHRSHLLNLTFYIPGAAYNATKVFYQKLCLNARINLNNKYNFKYLFCYKACIMLIDLSFDKEECR